MKRLHVNIHVKNVDESVNFYNALFASEPTVLKDDYAKWMLEDPKVNFAISLGKGELGVRHLGIQAETEQELKEIYVNIDKAEGNVDEEGHTVCCYAKSEKSWIDDPQGVKWEAFHTYGEGKVLSSNSKEDEEACCEPTCCN